MGSGFVLERTVLYSPASGITASAPGDAAVAAGQGAGPAGQATQAPVGPAAVPDPAESPLTLKRMQGRPLSGTTAKKTAAPAPAGDEEGDNGNDGDSGSGAPPSSGATPKEAAAETAVVKLTNAERAKAGCGSLRVDSRLRAAARAHSKDMAAHRNMSHTGSDGSDPWERMERAGYTAGGAENVAMGYPTATAVVQGWMNSPGHRANILNCKLRAIGVGVDFRNGGPWWTQAFGWS